MTDGLQAKASHGSAPGPFQLSADIQDKPGNPLVVDGEASNPAVKDPLAIGCLIVDQMGAEGSDPTGGLYSKHCSQRSRRLQALASGSEDLMTGGWVRVRVLVSAGSPHAC